MNIQPALKKMGRVLFFRISREDVLGFNSLDLILGLIITWLVGMGRYWDDPEAHLLQHLGLGSLVYIAVLTLLIWAILKPFKIEDWTYLRLLTFISLTSFPALLYAIPVEQYFNMKTAITINFWFLLIVALWRVMMLLVFLKRFAGLTIFETGIGGILPLMLIVGILSYLNLERAIFDIMSGIREQTSNDGAYFVLVVLTLFSYFLITPFSLCYGYIVYKKFKESKVD